MAQSSQVAAAWLVAAMEPLARDAAALIPKGLTAAGADRRAGCGLAQQEGQSHPHARTWQKPNQGTPVAGATKEPVRLEPKLLRIHIYIYIYIND